MKALKHKREKITERERESVGVAPRALLLHKIELSNSCEFSPLLALISVLNLNFCLFLLLFSSYVFVILSEGFEFMKLGFF